jgi:hypothetical protein
MRFVVLLVCLLLSASMAFGFGNKAGKPAPIAIETEALLRTLSQKPQLMNLAYLQYYIGRPANERTQRGNPTKQYHWYTPDRSKLLYEMYQQEAGHGQVVDSTFVAHLDEYAPSLEQVNKVFGEPTHRFFDVNSDLNELYTISPTTSLSFVSPRNLFRVSQAKVAYRGPVLGEPSMEDMKMAQDGLMNKAFLSADKEEEAAKAIPLLQMYVNEHPQEAEGHLNLAKAYANGGHVHHAANEYRLVQTMPNLTDEQRNRAVSGLKDLHHVPVSEDEQQQYKNLAVKRHGQRLKATGFDKKRKKDKDEDNADGTTAKDLSPAN